MKTAIRGSKAQITGFDKKRFWDKNFTWKQQKYEPLSRGFREKYLVVMGAIGAAERHGLREIREGLVARIERLEDLESYGSISAEEKASILASEYGHDWAENLRFINEILHRTNKRHQTVPHIKEAALITYLIIAVTVVALLAYPGITGAATSQNTLILEATLTADTPTRLLINEEIVITSVQTSPEAKIILTDAQGETILYDKTCKGCGKTFKPPYKLTSEGTTATIHSITYRSTR